MSLNPEFDSPRFKSDDEKRFKLSSVASPLTHAALTKLPSLEKVLLLDKLSPAMSSQIRTTLKLIYSHVTERVPSEGEDHFYHAVASSAFYENYHGKLIKGADHTKKAASLLPNIELTINSIDEAVGRLINPEHVPILRLFRSILVVHHNAVLKALRSASPTKQRHIEQFQGMDLTNRDHLPLTAEERRGLEQCFLVASPPKTPIKLTKADTAVISLLNPNLKPQRKLNFRLDDDFEDEDVEEENKETLFSKAETQDKDLFGISYSDFDSDVESGKSSDEDEDELEKLLCKEIDALIFTGPGFKHEVQPAKKPEQPQKQGLKRK